MVHCIGQVAAVCVSVQTLHRCAMTRFQLGSREMIQQEGFSEREPGGVLVAIRVHALALQVPVSAQAATNIIDGDTIDIDGVRIRIVQIDTPETFGPRCENELISAARPKSGFANCSTAALFHENIMEDSVMKPVIAIAMSMALLAPSVAWPVPSRQRVRRPVSRTSLAGTTDTICKRS